MVTINYSILFGNNFQKSINMKLAIFTSLVTSTSTFAPSASKAYNTALNGDTCSPDGLGVDPF